MSPSAPERIVVVGTSVAGVRTAQALRSGGFGGDLVVVGQESEVPYDKPPLSKQVLAGTQLESEIALLDGAGWSGLGVEARVGSAAVGLDLQAKHLELSDGDRVAYDALVIATGVRPRTLPPTAPQVMHTVRELRDIGPLRDQLGRGGPVVVVGSGFIGAEVASTARALGCPVTIVEASDQPFSRGVGTQVGKRLARMHLEAGVTLLSGTGVSSVEGLSDGTGIVHLADGRALEAAVVVVGIGVQPNAEWLEDSGLALDDGVVTDEHCMTHAPDVYAVGDVARWLDSRTGTHRRVEHWTNAVEQASVVAHNLLHPQDRRPHDATPYFWSDQHGVKIQMVGRAHHDDHVEVLECEMPSGARTIALYSDDGRFTASVALGWPRAVVSCRQSWARGADVAEVRSALLGMSSAVRALSS